MSPPAVTRLQWSADGARLYAIAVDGTRRAFDAGTLAEITPAPACDLTEPRDVSADGRWRVVIRDGKLEVVPSS